ncbi:MAG: tyrosinase family protein [Edaphobacter sp.]
MSTPLGSTRRHFLKTTLATAGAAALPGGLALAQSPAKYRRYNVTSPQGQKALASYARGVQVMLSRPADHAHNWFRNAFVHLMDCPHGNWWFYVWHRGYLGYFEQTIRTLSNDPTFAMPYWDWTQLPQIPDGMFNGVLTPTDSAYARYTRDIGTFTSFIRPSLMQYWNRLSSAQRDQLNKRGYTSFDTMWNDVTGYTTTPPPPHVDPTNTAFAQTPIARYLTRQNPKLSPQVTYNVSPFMVYSGLLPTDFYDPINQISFNSSMTKSHNTPPSGSNVFATLEGFPHNSTHNYIGGVGPIPNGPWGNMTNNLSPVDPIFFLHHSNMDRLWDVWTRKQQALGLPYLPNAAERPTYDREPFLFYVNKEGNQVGPSIAREFISTTRFEYDYEPGFGEAVVKRASRALMAKHATPAVKGLMKGNTATMMLSTSEVNTHLTETAPTSLIALVTVPRPTEGSPHRNFDVLVGAPADATDVNPDSPYYAGTIAFFGNMMHMPGMSSDATFIVPLPQRKQVFANLGAAESKGVALTIRVVPSGGGASVLKSATVRAL